MTLTDTEPIPAIPAAMPKQSHRPLHGSHLEPIITLGKTAWPAPQSPLKSSHLLRQRWVSSRGLMIGLLLGTDLIMLVTALMGAFMVPHWVGGEYELATHFHIGSISIVFLLAYMCVRLYPSVPLSTSDELRQLTVTNLFVCLGLGSLAFVFGENHLYSSTVFVAALVLVIVLVPIGRALLRLVVSTRSWWGYPVVIIGEGTHAAAIIDLLQREPSIGLKPVAVVHAKTTQQQSIHGVPAVGGYAQVGRLARQYRLRYAIVTLPDLPLRHANRIMDRLAKTFDYLLVVPDLPALSSLWVAPVDLQGMLGLRIRNRLLDPWRRSLKRGLDIALITAAAPVFAIVVGLIATMIRLNSPGPVFYGQRRIGKRGRHFTCWKFRTMVQNADQILDNYLIEHPELRREWEQDHKLKDDPRITRVGRWLRRTSLDELPQLWNALRGEMSLVGPRPIVDDEVDKYGKSYELYKQVRPGITGMWQVSGRNLLSYDERVAMDVYYVRNWSVWLDMDLLLRTLRPVLTSYGAY